MHDTLVKPDALTWKDNPNVPKGGQVTILIGDPKKQGEVVVQRLKFPPNYQVPPHTHPYTEYGTVISGSFGVGVGEKLDKKGELSKPGSFWMHPAGHPHYGWTGSEEVVIQIQFTGPGGIAYVNPADGSTRGGRCVHSEGGNARGLKSAATQELRQLSGGKKCVPSALADRQGLLAICKLKNLDTIVPLFLSFISPAPPTSASAVSMPHLMRYPRS